MNLVLISRKQWFYSDPQNSFQRASSKTLQSMLKPSDAAQTLGGAHHLHIVSVMSESCHE